MSAGYTILYGIDPHTRSARILLREGYNLGVLHLQGSDEWRISLNNNVVPLAEGRDVRLCIERMHLDLINRWCNPGFRIEKLLQLQCR
jgi:hypothetical protein